MFFHIIASGSKGNATIIKENKTVILIDMGITLTRLKEGLKEIDLSIEDICGAFFTHNHADHISGIRFLSPKIMYGLEGTLPPLCHKMNMFESTTIGDFKITPVPTSHDATNPCGFIVETKEEKLVYITDTGIMPEETIKWAQNPDYLIIESNHDIQMLLATSRPYELKNRILSEKGHLCNEDSAIASVSIIGDKTKEIILAHLSEEANSPAKALEAYQRIFIHFGKDINQYNVRAANQWRSLTGGKYEH